MKINKIEIFGYGKLSHCEFEFNQFQAILGLNEAGKTTMINFIKDMLFGFTKRKTTHPYAPKDKSEMGGLLEISVDKITYIIERVEGKNGGDLKLSDKNGLQLPPELLKKILGPINRDTFDNLFYFGSPNLADISKLNKDELETRIRQVGVIGVEEWLKLKKSIEKAADDIYKQRGKNPLLNQALNDYEKSQQKLLEAQKSYDIYLDLNHQYQKLIQKKQQLSDKSQTTFEQLRLVQGDEQNWNNYEILKSNLKEQIDLLPGYLTSDMDKFKDILSHLNLLKEQVKKSQLIVQQQNENKLNTSDDFKLYLANKNKFDDLYLQLGDQVNNERNYENGKRELDNLEQQIAYENDSAGGNNSLLFNNEDLNRVNRLLDDRRSLKAQQAVTGSISESNQKNNTWILFIVIGLIVGCVGLLVGGLGLITLVVIAAVLIGTGFYFKNQANTKPTNNKIDYEEKIKQIDTNLQAIADEYQIENNNPETWTTTLQDSIKKRNLTRHRIEMMKKELQQNQQGIVNYISSWSLEGLHPNEISRSLSQIKQFMIKNQDMQKEIEHQQERIDEKQAEIIEYQKQIESLEQEQKLFLQERGLNSEFDFKQQYQIQQDARKQQDKINELQNSLSNQIIERLQEYNNQDELQDKLKELKAADKANAEMLTEISQNESAIKGEIEALAKNGTYDELRQEIASKKTEINDLVSNWLVFKLTDEWIEKVLNLASHGRFPLVQKLAQKYFTILTNHHYVSVEYGKKIRVKSADGTKFDAKELSRGTMQQLYLSLIFALTMSFSDEYPMPILIDDGFVDFDHVRTDAAINLMKEISEKTQVIYFTADDRIIKQVKLEDLIKLD